MTLCAGTRRYSAALIFMLASSLSAIKNENSYTFAAGSDADVFAQAPQKSSYTFAVVPKRTNSPFWQTIKDGCMTGAKRQTKSLGVNVTCLFTGPDEGGPETEARQAKIVEDLIAAGEIDGMALAVVAEPSAESLIAKAIEKGIPVVTYDSDAIDSQRLTYIGTNNVAMGKELGRVLLQVEPEGGTYGIIAAGSPNIQERVQGVREALANSAWVEAEDSLKNCEGSPILAVQQMGDLVDAHPDLGAIIPVGGWPMYEGLLWQDFVDENPNVFTVVGDSNENQIDLMNMGYASALVGQLPFEMGQFSVDKLLEVQLRKEQGLTIPSREKNIPTSFLDVVNIPQDIPPLVIDMNYLGSRVILGYILCGIILMLSVGFSVFSLKFRDHRIIKKSQPKFLVMACIGTFLVGSAIIPLSIDDENYSQRGCDIACMSWPWLLSIGFVTAFSALFSKIWRINKIFHHPQRFRRVKITEKDVLGPFAALMTINVIVLVCWTIIAPLTFERQPSSGTDNWNRVYKSYYGKCTSKSDAAGGSLPYAIILLLVNFAAVVIANIQAYQARNVHVEFSESKYIAMATASILQAMIIGIPVIALFQEKPQANYIVQSLLIFLTCTTILLLLFVPKLSYMREYEKDRAAKKANAATAGVSFNPRPSSGAEELKFSIMRKQNFLPSQAASAVEEPIQDEDATQRRETWSTNQ